MAGDEEDPKKILSTLSRLATKSSFKVAHQPVGENMDKVIEALFE